MKNIKIKGKEMILPTFFPDATRGVIRSLSSEDLIETGTEGLIVNTYHLLSQPGPSVLKSIGGVRNFMNWPGWIISDSGGFQMFSLIQKNKSLGKIHEDGVTFHLHSKSGRKKYLITPEKCIQMQFDIGSDIMIVLDYFTPHTNKYEDIKLSVDWTLDWAKRCKIEFEKQLKARKLSDHNRPHLFSVIQGWNSREERERCAVGLEKIGFDGYGLGGWPFDEDGNLLDIVKFVGEVTPKDKPKYGLGIGNPQGLVDAISWGYQIFDCVLPTRDARHKRLYVFEKNPKDLLGTIFSSKNWYGYVYPGREKFIRDTEPISKYCDCYTCRNYSMSYLNHLFRIDDSLAWRLSTIHNLYFYSSVIKICRDSIDQ